MPIIDPSWKPVAFKEWVVVCDAIASGEQSIILRKGGISEGKHGFQWMHDQFLLFPTLFHEQGQLVRPAADGSTRKFSAGSKDPEGDIDFGLYIETKATGRLTDWEEICELEPFHIWTRDCIRERFEWGDEFGISYAVIRAAKLVANWTLPDRKSFGGCRSWIGLPAEENGGFLEKVTPADWIKSKCSVPDFSGK